MTEPRAWCLHCGRTGPILGPALTEPYVIIRCTWSSPDGKSHGHGITTGTLDQAESDTLVLRRREAVQLRNHNAGRHDVTPVYSCASCQRAAGHKRHVARREADPTCAECGKHPPGPEALTIGTSTAVKSAASDAAQEVQE